MVDFEEEVGYLDVHVGDQVLLDRVLVHVEAEVDFDGQV